MFGNANAGSEMHLWKVSQYALEIHLKNGGKDFRNVNTGVKFVRCRTTDTEAKGSI